MKFNIIICDDVKTEITKIASSVFDFFENTENEFNCHLIQSNFESVLDYAKNTENCRNVYLLDINFNEHIDGLELARRIREYDYAGYIIFITAHTELAITALSYRLKILDFIDKSDKCFDTRLTECFRTVIKESAVIRTEEHYITVKSGFERFYIYLNDILFIETDSIGRKIIIHTINKSIESSIPLKSIMNDLDKRFFRCHRAIAVNTRKIIKICTNRNNAYIELIGGSKCPLSLRKAKDLMQFMSNK